MPLTEAPEQTDSDNISIHLSEDDEEEIGIDKKSLDSYAMAMENIENGDK